MVMRRIRDEVTGRQLEIEKALADAGASFADVVRVTYILKDRNDWPACWPATVSC